MSENVTNIRIVDDKRSGLATACLVLGIVAIIGSWIPFLNVFSIIMGYVGLGLGIPALIIYFLKKRGSLVKCIAGVVLCILSLVIAYSSTHSAIKSIDNALGTDADSKTEYAYGETAELKGIAIRVLDVERSDGDTSGYFPITPSNQDDVFVIVEVEIKNNSDETKSYNEFDYSIQTGNGEIHSTGFSMYNTGNDLGSGQLAAGGIKIGKIVFEAPRDDNNLMLIYKGNMFDSKERKFKLQ